METIRTAVLYGADAIYMGTPDMSMRTKSKLSLEDVVEGTKFAHDHGVKVYLTLNLISHNRDIPKLGEYIETVRAVNPDGLIVADPGVFQYVREHAPDIDLHVSTQANACSWLTVNFWQRQGAKLVVLGREVSFEELSEIREKCPDIKLEAFVHGAMCMTYSGRCLLSNFMAERGANQGNCANACRWEYKVHLKLKDGSVHDLRIDESNGDLFEFFLEEGYRPGELLPIIEDERGSYILNSKDLCLMPKLDDYMRIGVDTLKVEGRNRSPYYVGITARAYRQAIDDWHENPDQWNPKPYLRELETVGSRGYTLAFHEGRLTNYAHGYDHTAMLAEWEYGGFVREHTGDALIMTVKNKFEAGDVLEFVPPKGREPVLLRLYEFETEHGKIVDAIHAGQQQALRIPFSAFDREDPEKVREFLPPLTLIRKERSLTKVEWIRIKQDRAALRLDQDQGNVAAFEDNKKKLKHALEEDLMERTPRSPRLGAGGCCGKGCNGCLIFWNDPQYAKAREILSKKKQGEMLDTGGVGRTGTQ